MVIGFNPNYPALHMREALEAIVNGESVRLGNSALEVPYLRRSSSSRTILVFLTRISRRFSARRLSMV